MGTSIFRRWRSAIHGHVNKECGKPIVLLQIINRPLTHVFPSPVWPFEAELSSKKFGDLWPRIKCTRRIRGLLFIGCYVCLLMANFPFFTRSDLFLRYLSERITHTDFSCFVLLSFVYKTLFFRSNSKYSKSSDEDGNDCPLTPPQSLKSCL